MPRRWSPSNLGTMHRCAEQYRRRYVEGEIIPPELQQIRGRAVHRAVELNMQAHVEDGDYLPIEAVEDAASDALTLELGVGGWVCGPLYDDLTIDQATGRVRDQAVKLSALHATEVAPTFTPAAAELKVEIQASPGMPATLVGVIDIVDETQKIRDTKTTGKSPPKGAADDSGQLTFYELLYQAFYGAPSRGQSLDYLVMTPKRGDLKTVTLETERSTEDLISLVERIRVADRAVEADIFVPAPTDHWACSPQWCGYYDTCRYVAGVRRPTS